MTSVSGAVALRGRTGDAPRPVVSSRAVDGALARKPVPRGLEIPERRQPAADVERSAWMVARALLEVVSGWRPVGQLSRHTSYSLQQDLERRAPRRPTGQRLKLLKVRLSHPADGVAEVCALAHDPNRGRVRVFALRMEDRRGEWVVTRLQTG